MTSSGLDRVGLWPVAACCLCVILASCGGTEVEDCEVAGTGDLSALAPDGLVDDSWADFEIAFDGRVTTDGVAVVRFAFSGEDAGFADNPTLDATGISLTIALVDTSGGVPFDHEMLLLPWDPEAEPLDVFGIPLTALPATWVFSAGGNLVLAANDPSVSWSTVNEFVERARRL